MINECQLSLLVKYALPDYKTITY